MNFLREQRKVHAENLSVWCMSQDKLAMMKFLGCDEKYYRKQASDFELLAEWERILPCCVGTGSAQLYEEQLALLGVEKDADVKALWQKGNLAICDEKIKYFQEEQEKSLKKQGFDIVHTVTYFTKSEKNAPGSFEEMIAKISSMILSGDSIFFDARGMTFARPDRYHATLAWDKLISGENFNNEEFFLFCFQLLIEVLLLRKKENQPTTVCLLSEESSLRRSFACYLRDHCLMKGTLRVSAFLNESCDEWRDFCGLSSELLIAPALFVRPSDFGASLENSLSSFVSGYPIGGVRFGGLLSESFSLAWAARALLLHKIDELLLKERVCDENRQKILKNIFNY